MSVYTAVTHKASRVYTRQSNRVISAAFLVLFCSYVSTVKQMFDENGLATVKQSDRWKIYSWQFLGRNEISQTVKVG